MSATLSLSTSAAQSSARFRNCTAMRASAISTTGGLEGLMPSANNSLRSRPRTTARSICSALPGSYVQEVVEPPVRFRFPDRSQQLFELHVQIRNRVLAAIVEPYGIHLVNLLTVNASLLV